MARACLLPLLAASLMLPGVAFGDTEVEQLKQLVKRLEQRVQELERRDAHIDKGLDTDTLSENEPELTARLKALEHQSVSTLKAARTVESLEGIKVGASLTTVAQHPGGHPAGSAANQSELNYRGDVFVGLPLEHIGDAEQQLFAQFRFGQGNGLNDLAAFSHPNASAFRVLSTKADDSVAVLGQAWYQASIPLPLAGFKPRSHETLELNFGKMDPFVFFDQNAAANDETRQFLNTAFVHNPLLDAAGDIGVDANGFSPGFRVSYLNRRDNPETWRLSLGVFGAGEGANYSRFFSSPLVIAQAERSLKLFEGLTGNYRAYYWRNGQAADLSGLVERHSGVGLSVDQRYGDAVTLFGRYGHQVSGDVRFGRALTLGAELGGSYWQRGADAVGVALGWLRTSPEFAAASLALDAYAASGAERVLELYYRYRIGKQFELTPDLQYIAAPAGNQDAAAVSVLGLRAQVTY
ncbi:MAG: carbohydrate porin [Burkholderiales bacterium]